MDLGNEKFKIFGTACETMYGASAADIYENKVLLEKKGDWIMDTFWTMVVSIHVKNLLYNI